MSSLLPANVARPISTEGMFRAASRCRPASEAAISRNRPVVMPAHRSTACQVWASGSNVPAKVPPAMPVNASSAFTQAAWPSADTTSSEKKSKYRANPFFQNIPCS